MNAGYWDVNVNSVHVNVNSVHVNVIPPPPSNSTFVNFHGKKGVSGLVNGNP